MNAYEIPGEQFTLNAASACERHRFIKVDANGLAAHATAATDPIVGISYMEADATQPLSIVGGGIAMVEAGATIAAGDLVTAGTDGKAAKAADGKAGFVALTGAGDGQLISVKL